MLTAAKLVLPALAAALFVGRGVVRGAHAAAADGGYCGCWR